MQQSGPAILQLEGRRIQVSGARAEIYFCTPIAENLNVARHQQPLRAWLRELPAKVKSSKHP